LYLLDRRDCLAPNGPCRSRTPPIQKVILTIEPLFPPYLFPRERLLRPPPLRAHVFLFETLEPGSSPWPFPFLITLSCTLFVEAPLRLFSIKDLLTKNVDMPVLISRIQNSGVLLLRTSPRGCSIPLCTNPPVFCVFFGPFPSYRFANVVCFSVYSGVDLLPFFCSRPGRAHTLVFHVNGVFFLSPFSQALSPGLAVQIKAKQSHPHPPKHTPKPPPQTKPQGICLAGQ